MEHTGKVALGFAVHTGWAAALAVGGTLRAPRIPLRDTVELLEKKRAFVFHAAAGRPAGGSGAPTPFEKINLAHSARLLEHAASDALRRATAAIARMLEGVRAEGLEAAGCAVVANAGDSSAPLADVLRAHPRIHTAEGHFYRDALLAAARKHGLPARVFPGKTLVVAAAKALGEPGDRVEALLAAAGKVVGRPWTRDQKSSALAAWVLLASVA
jgi:hypothetical protein